MFRFRCLLGGRSLCPETGFFFDETMLAQVDLDGSGLIRHVLWKPAKNVNAGLLSEIAPMAYPIEVASTNKNSSEVLLHFLPCEFKVVASLAPPEKLPH